MKFKETKLLYACLVATSLLIFQASTLASVENKHSYHKQSHHKQAHHKKSHNSPVFDDEKIIIKSVWVEIANSQIIINGLNMDDGSSPLVKLADEDLITQSYTEVQIVVSLPPGILDGDYVLQVKNDETRASYLLTIGAVGPIGPTGAQGIQGETGLEGNKGDKGDTGFQGTKGDTGFQGAKGDTGEQGLKGDTGAQGTKGDTGAQGTKGDTGAQGLKGDTGVQGLKGDTGLQGNTGAQGAKGDRGPQGVPGEIVGTKVSMYKCPVLDKGSLGGGAWGFYGCQGQISSNRNCLTIEHPKSITSTCNYMGSFLLQP